MSVLCPVCNAENAPDVLFCVSCGRPLGEGSGADALIGQQILGTYELTELLGQGGMSVVYRARHMLTEQEVAVKVLPPELSQQREVKARFIEEARTLARLEHPNIVVLHNFVEQEGFLYLVMQCADGETFDSVITREGRVAIADAVAVGIEVLRALEYAHEQGVVHRDIKPSNVILRGDGSVKVMDFGIAKFIGSSKLTQTGQTMGTVRYMSPEQVRGKQLDHRTDIYSLGVTLFEAITGRTPFGGENHFEIMQKHLTTPPPRPSELVPMPGALEESLLRAMAKPAEARFQTAREFRHALQQVPVAWERRKPSSSLPLPLPMLAAEEAPGQRRPLRVAPIVLAVLLLLVSGSAVLWALLDPREPAPPVAADSGRAAPQPGSETRPAIAWPAPHPVTRALTWKVSRTFPKLGLRILSMGEVDADALRDLYLRARAAYPRFLHDEGMNLPVTVGPLTLAIVDQKVLNSTTHFPDSKADVSYPTRYMAPAATLFVHNSEGFLRTDLPYGLALHFCARVAQFSNQRCLELAEGFEIYLRGAR